MVLNVPDFFDLNEKEVSLALAAKLYEDRRLSLGQAAELVGISKRAFVELLGTQSVSLFNISNADLIDDIANA